jgi:lysophospholipase L1-like esterase
MKRLMIVLAVVVAAGAAVGAAGVAVGLKGEGPKGPAVAVQRPSAISLVVVGDSVAFGAGDESGAGGIAGRLKGRNAGINGARTRNVKALLRTPAMRTTLANITDVVLSIGGNDLYGDSIARGFVTLAPGLAMRLTLMRVASIVRTLHETNPHLRIHLLGIYNPYGRRELDTLVAEWNSMLMCRFAGEPWVTFVPIADIFAPGGRLSPLDRFHPSADAYSRIARRIADGL